MTETYIAENRAERQRLFEITAKLTAENLAQPTLNGWPVALKLAHLAYWDLYALALLQEWEKTGYKASSANVDAVNEAVRVLSNAIPVLSVIPLVREAAEAVDRKVEELAPELAAEIEAGSHARMLCRFLHRRNHLNQIESALGH